MYPAQRVDHCGLRVLWANAGFYALAGRSHAEYEQDVHAKALLVVHSDDRARLLGAFRSSLVSNIPVHAEYSILHRDGGIVWLYLQASLVGYRDGVPIFQGVFVDVSKQKNTMRALKLERQQNHIVAELTNDIIFEYDYDTNEMTCSERYETIFHTLRFIPNYRSIGTTCSTCSCLRTRKRFRKPTAALSRGRFLRLHPPSASAGRRLSVVLDPLPQHP